MWTVQIKRSAAKELKRVPDEITDAFEAWKLLVETSGPTALRKVVGYWDHALAGEWKGARASSLSREWRVIYWVESGLVMVHVVTVTKHDYRRKR